MKFAETRSSSLCNKFYTYLYHHIVVLDRYIHSSLVNTAFIYVYYNNYVTHLHRYAVCSYYDSPFDSPLHAVLSPQHDICISSHITINLLAPELFFFNFSTPVYKNVNNTGTKYVRIMKQTAF